MLIKEGSVVSFLYKIRDCFYELKGQVKDVIPLYNGKRNIKVKVEGALVLGYCVLSDLEVQQVIKY